VAPTLPHISVCICTYKRPQLLQRALDALREQETRGYFTFSIVVVDNDKEETGHGVATAAATGPGPWVTYCVETRQSIPLARNKAIANATGEFVAFLDDDEYTIKEWLVTLFLAYREYGVDGVLGPVKPYFDKTAPKWAVKGNFYLRPTYPTGLVINWRKGRTGNVLLRRDLFDGSDEPFRAEFRVGEDQDFFRRAIAQGRVFVWCNEAVAYEYVPRARCKRSFMWRRALLRGADSLLHPTFGMRDVAKSVIAIPAYTAVLPFSLIVGQGAFMNYSVKLFDHLGRLLALVGIRPVKVPYVTE